MSWVGKDEGATFGSPWNGEDRSDGNEFCLTMSGGISFQAVPEVKAKLEGRCSETFMKHRCFLMLLRNGCFEEIIVW